MPGFESLPGVWGLAYATDTNKLLALAGRAGHNTGGDGCDENKSDVKMVSVIF